MLHPLHQTLFEALDPFCNEKGRERILALAALATGEGDIPTDVFEFSEFVRGPLSDAATQVLGEDVAEQVRQHLAPILMTASSGCRAGKPRTEKRNNRFAVVVQQPGTARDYVVSVLTEIGFRVTTSEDAMATIAVIANHQPALLCVESELSGITATQLVTMVRRAYGEQAPAFVMVPSGGDFEPADLLAAIDESLNPRADAG